MKAKMQKISEKFFLSAAEIDRFSEKTAGLLQQTNVNSKDILRFRLSMENVMDIWFRELGEGISCSFSSGSKFGRAYIVLTADGKKVNPNEYQDELLAGISNGSSLLAALGLTLEYRYEAGQNILKLTLPKGQAGQLMPVLICMLAGALFGGVFEFVFPEAGGVVQEWVVSPVFDTLMNLLSVIAGPMIFLAVYSGIYGIGDTLIFGKIGRHLIVRFLLMTFLVLFMTGAVVLWFFPVSFGGTNIEGNAMMELYKMVLAIVPADMVSPFQTGNALQIIFLACACGVGTLILGNSVSELIKIVNQINAVVQLLMDTIGRLIPLFVFICVMNLFMSGGIHNVSGLFKQIGLCVMVAFVTLALYVGFISWRYKVRLGVLVQKLLPTFLIALSTASSSAAFGTNIECCERKLGIDRKLVNFGVPMGQVVYMPIGAVMFLIASLCIGESYGVEISMAWVLTAIFVSGILAAATPPIPGGAMSCYTILFTQLGIPAAGIALAISVDLIMDYFITACNITCLQTELVVDARKLDMLMESRLREKI